MREFMFFIRKQRNSEATLPAEQHQKFLKACERYIGKLKQDGKLISAQPIEWVGKIVSRSGGASVTNDLENDLPAARTVVEIDKYYLLPCAKPELAL